MEKKRVVWMERISEKKLDEAIKVSPKDWQQYKVGGYWYLKQAFLYVHPSTQYVNEDEIYTLQYGGTKDDMQKVIDVYVKNGAVEYKPKKSEIEKSDDDEFDDGEHE